MFFFCHLCITISILLNQRKWNSAIPQKYIILRFGIPKSFAKIYLEDHSRTCKCLGPPPFKKPWSCRESHLRYVLGAHPPPWPYQPIRAKLMELLPDMFWESNLGQVHRGTSSRRLGIPPKLRWFSRRIIPPSKDPEKFRHRNYTHEVSQRVYP